MERAGVRSRPSENLVAFTNYLSRRQTSESVKNLRIDFKKAMEGNRIRKNFRNYIIYTLITLLASSGLCHAGENVSVGARNSASATAESGEVSVSGDVSGPITIESGDASASVDAMIITNGEKSSLKAEAKAEAGEKKAEVKKELNGTDGDTSFRETVENGGAKATVEVGQNTSEEALYAPEPERSDIQTEKKEVETEQKGIAVAVADAIVSGFKNTLEKIFEFFS